MGRTFTARRDESARHPAGERRHHHQPGEVDGIAAVLRRQPGDDGAEQNGQEGAALDQRIAGRQFGAGEMVGQDTVLDRAEQRGDHAEQKHRNEKQDERMEGETCYGERGNADLGELQALRHERLVVAVGEFAAESRKKEERRNQRCAGQRDQCFRVGTRDLEQNDEDERRLEEVVAEGREELAPEQGRETSRRHQGRGHGSPAVGACSRDSLAARARLGDAESSGPAHHEALPRTQIRKILLQDQWIAGSGRST